MDPISREALPRTPRTGSGLLAATAGAALLALQSAAFAQTPSPQAQDGPADRDIRDAVEDEFVVDRAVPEHRIDVTVDDGVVTLAGTAADLLAKDRAVAIARTVRGVRAVVDRVRVAPPPGRGPAGVQRDVMLALAGDPATESYDVRATCAKDGTVTLEGKVQSWAERDLAATVTKNVTGVTAITNAITVAPDVDRSDREIAHDVRGRLFWDVLVDDGLVDVDVEDGVVRLSGTVGSVAEQERARRDAFVTGVSKVDMDALQVAEWAADEELRDSEHAVRAPTEIQRAVVAALERDPRVSPFDIEVSVGIAEVTLRGEVDNLKAARAAADDARNTLGVAHVTNRLRVRPDDQRSDADVRADVVAALARDPMVYGAEVTVAVHDGVVELSGIVASSRERARADDVAARVGGVVGVENVLGVRDPVIVPFDPYVDETPIHRYPWFRYHPPVTFERDERVAARVRNQLEWSPYVDEDDVAVAVEGGVVTLSGAVRTRAVRDVAIANAYDGGATWVVDRLQIDPAATVDEEAEADGN